MEKGSFQKPNVPIPSEVPEKLDLSHLPNNIARSGAIEALIHQNEDLMARLSVSLRRISLLEDNLNHGRQANEKLKFQYENLKDQLYILKEKAASITERKSSSEVQFQELKKTARKLKEQLRLAEVRYSELYTSSKERQEQLQTKIDDFAIRISRFLRYRRKVKQAIFNYKKKSVLEISELETQKQQIENDLIAAKDNLEAELNTEIERLKNENQMVVNKLQVTESTLQEVRDKLTQTTNYIQEQSKNYHEEKNQLIENYETRLRNLTAEHNTAIDAIKLEHSEKLEAIDKEVGKLQTENRNLEDKCNELDKIYEDNVQLQNKIVFIERKREELRASTREEIEKLQKSLAHYRGESKVQIEELEELRQYKIDLNSQNKDLSRSKSELEQQVENLQNLWRETQTKLEVQAEKNMALQKMNQQLSTNLNISRKEIKDLKTQLDINNQEAKRKIGELKKNAETAIQIQGLQSGDEEFHPRLMNKIDSLIAEIQSGFSSKRESDEPVDKGL